MAARRAWKMNKSDENKIAVFQSRCFRRIFKIRWQDIITNKELLQMADMENLIEDVRRMRWKFIGHIMRKEPDNNCRAALTWTWTPEGRRKRGADPRQHGEGQRREQGKELDGRTGVRYTSQRQTELVGGRVLRPYVPHAMKRRKRIGERG